MADADKATGVSYGVLDAFKRRGQAAASHAESSEELGRLGVTHFKPSRGESAYLMRSRDGYLAHVEEGLGTKILVIDALARIAESFKFLLGDRGYMSRHLKMRGYANVSWDTVAMIVNDMITVGAMPASVAMHCAVGDEAYLADEMRAYGLVSGWQLACKESACFWGPGETPALSDIVYPGTAVLSGSAMGVIEPGRLPMLPERIVPGDEIIFCESSGIHANGITKAREIADTLPDGYLTEVPGSGGRCYGDVLLDRTHIYVPFVRKVLTWHGVKYGVNVTGHGWRKLMRAPQPLTYVIETLPAIPVIFPFIQEHGAFSVEQMYCAYNMGVGFALIVASADTFMELASRKQNWPFHVFRAGRVEAGPKQVVIEPLDLTLPGDSMHIR